VDVEGEQTSHALLQNLHSVEGDLMNLKSRPSSWIFKRTASILGALVLSSVLLPTGPATAASLAPALSPTFSTPISTATGFTVNITNFDPDFTFTPATSAGSVVVGDRHDHNIRLTVSALAFGASATITVTTTRAGYGTGSANVTGSALLAALIATFSTPVSTATGFTVNVTNFNPAYRFTPRTSAGHVVAGVASGTMLPLTVTQLNARSSGTITVTTTRNGYVAGSATSTGSKLPEAALTPTFSAPVSTATGFTVNITNYNSAYTFTPTTSAGSILVAEKHDNTLRLTVSALAAGASATVTVTTARTGYINGSAALTASALLAALTPTFNAPVPTATGFTINVTNYNSAFVFALRTSAGHVVAGVASGNTLPLTISQLNSRSSSTITVTTTRTGYVTGRASVTGSKLPNAALTPTFSTPISTATGFTVNITNYNSAYTFTPTTSAGRVSVGDRHDHTIRLTLTGLAPGISATIKVTTARNGYGAGSATVTGSALLAALIPTFSTSVPTTTGFTINVTNYDPAFTFTTKTSQGHVVAGVASGTTLPLTVQLTSRSRITITVTTTRTGYATGHATVTGSRGARAALIPTFSTPVSTATGFTVNITNYNPAFNFTPTTSAGRVAVSKKHEHTLRLSVFGLTPGANTTLTVATSRNGYSAGSATVTGSALLAALIPTFSTPVSTATGFTVNVTNYNPAFTFTAKTSQGHVVTGVAQGSTLPLTIQLTSRSTITIKVTTTRTGYATAHATVTGRSL
jgi:hypothetical protein